MGRIGGPPSILIIIFGSHKYHRFSGGEVSLRIVSHVADDLFPVPCNWFPGQVLDQALCLLCVYYTW
jgi:hypothetical protein